MSSIGGRISGNRPGDESRHTEREEKKLRLMFIKAVVFFVKMGAESEKSGEN